MERQRNYVSAHFGPTHLEVIGDLTESHVDAANGPGAFF